MSNVIPFGGRVPIWTRLGYVAAVVHHDGSISLVDSLCSIRTNYRDAAKDLREIRKTFPTLTSKVVVVRGTVHR